MPTISAVQGETVGRRGTSAALAGLVALVVLAGAPATGLDYEYTATPASGPPGATVTLSGGGCPVGSDGIAVDLLDPAGDHVLASASMSGGTSWSGAVAVPAEARNGSYGLLVRCGASGYLAPMRRFTVDGGTSGVRLAGASRIATAVAVSRDLHPDGGTADAVVLSRFDGYADALAGSPLAASLGAPLLLTAPATLDPVTRAEIERVLVPGGAVHVLGGRAAISDAVAAQLTTMGYRVVRYAGANRYDTAVRIARTFGPPGAVLLANGNDFREGLVAGVAAAQAGQDAPAVLLLTNGRSLPAETRAYLDDLRGVSTFAVGAPAAAAMPTAVPLVGADAADTSRKVAAQFFPAPAAVGLANASSFADGLAGGAHAAANGAPLLLTNPGALPPTVRTYLVDRRAAVVIAFVYGGTGAVADTTFQAARAAIT
ncbi:MAG: putative cell wall binding repeat 2-containing protein [Actinomycetia bacterium]|nr:putative cell wall binding repeat 2-containing protein [Actinomycetes bacterium]